MRMSPRQSLGIALWVLTCVAPPLYSQTSFVTSAALFTNPVTVGFASLPTGSYFITTPASLPGGLTVSATNAPGFLNNAASGYGLLHNGNWRFYGISSVSDTRNFPNAALRISFATPVSAAGGFINYCRANSGPCFDLNAHQSPVVLRAFDALGNLLGAYDVSALAPIITTSTSLNAGDFRGIISSSANISALEYAGQFTVMGSVTYNAVVVPEPATVVLLATGLGGLLMLAYSTRRAAGPTV